MINYYLELELDHTSNTEELQKELVKTQKKWLNRTNSSDLDKRTLAEKKLEIIEEAKQTLLDPEAKIDYDDQLFMEEEEEDSIQDEPVINELDFNAWGSEIQSFIDEENYAQAIATGKELTELAPDEAISWRFYGIAQRIFGNEEFSRKCFTKALELDPLDIFSYEELAFSYKKNKEYQRAVLHFKQVLHLDSDHEAALRELGFLQQIEDDYDAGLDYMKELVEKHPSEENKAYLAEAYFLKAQDIMPTNKRNQYFFFEEEKIHAYIELTEKAQSISPQEEYVQQLKKARKALRKTYDWSKVTLLSIPLFLSEGSSFLAVVLLAVILYYSIRPKWIIERRSTFGTELPFDKIANLYTKTVGRVIIKLVAFIAGIFGATIDSSKYR